jgi:hypothetical protein
MPVVMIVLLVLLSIYIGEGRMRMLALSIKNKVLSKIASTALDLTLCTAFAINVIYLYQAVKVILSSF